jgi:hypothetical protein
MPPEPRAKVVDLAGVTQMLKDGEAPRGILPERLPPREAGGYRPTLMI